MADPGDPVTDQPARKEEVGEGAEVGGAPPVEADGDNAVAKSSSWWGGLSTIGTYLQQPHLIEAGLTAAAAQVSQATSQATQMVKSKSMEVVHAVQGDLNEVKETVKTAATPILPMVGGATSKLSGATSALRSTIKEIDEVTDEMAEAAINGVTKSVSSFWNMASGYASQMFSEDDLPADTILVGADNEPIILDRLQAQLHALASDTSTYTQEPDPSDQLSEDWTSWLAHLNLDSRQGEISELVINNATVRRMYGKLVPAEVSHKLFWARYFYKVHLIEKQEMKRQVLKKRAEQTKEEEDQDINWDDDDDLQPDLVEIPDDLQEKLLKDYEKELKGGGQAVSKHAKKDSSASDDWEKLSDEAK